MARIRALVSVNSPPTTASRFDPHPPSSLHLSKLLRELIPRRICPEGSGNLRLAPRFLHFLSYHFALLLSPARDHPKFTCVHLTPS